MADTDSGTKTNSKEEETPLKEEHLKTRDDANNEASDVQKDSALNNDNHKDESDGGEKNGSDAEEKEETEAKKEDNSDEEEESESEPEEKPKLPPGLLEQPLEIQGKREKKKVDRLSAAAPPSAEKKKIEIEEGSGTKLGEIDYIESKLSSTKAMDLKSLHRLLYLRIGAATEVKRNIRKFSGFTHSKESKEHDRREALLNKMVLPELKSMCLVLGLERNGSKKDIVERVLEFLMSPKRIAGGRDNTVTKKAKRASKSSDNKEKKGKKRKKTSATKEKPKKVKAKKKEDNDDDIDSLDEESAEEEEVLSEVETVESEDEEPKKKKAKTEPKNKLTVKLGGKKEKASPKKDQKPSPKKKKSDISDDDLSSDSDDEPISNLKKKVPPTNDEIKALVKKILEGADLESVTMKTVVKEVYSKYPGFDLSDKKDFIKNTVREEIS